MWSRLSPTSPLIFFSYHPPFCILCRMIVYHFYSFSSPIATPITPKPDPLDIFRGFSFGPEAPLSTFATIDPGYVQVHHSKSMILSIFCNPFSQLTPGACSLRSRDSQILDVLGTLAAFDAREKGMRRGSQWHP